MCTRIIYVYIYLCIYIPVRTPWKPELSAAPGATTHSSQYYLAFVVREIQHYMMNKTRLDITGHASTSNGGLDTTLPCRGPRQALSSARVCHFFYDGGTYIATHTLSRAFFLSLPGMQACRIQAPTCHNRKF